jgi:hypothetical protein
MNVRNLFRVTAVLFLLAGLGWLLTPGSAAGMIGRDINPYEAYLVRALGANSVGFAVLAFLASRMAQSPERQAVATAFLVFQLASLIVNLLAVLGGVVPGGAGWIGVALNLVIALAFAYFRFIRTEATVTPGLQS